MKFINPSGSPQQTRMSKDLGGGKIGLFDSGFGSVSLARQVAGSSASAALNATPIASGLAYTS